jgi:hypothetical protein
MSVTCHTLYVAGYSRGRDIDREGNLTILLRYHWSFYIDIHPRGIAHELNGSPSTFQYWGPEPNKSLKRGTSLRAKIQIGQFPADKLDRVTELLRQVPIEQNKPGIWNCQSWILDGMEVLKKEGYVEEKHTPEMVRFALRERMELEKDSDDEIWEDSASDLDV